MLAGPDGQESNERNLHASQRSKSVPSRVADVESRAEAAHADQDKGVKRQQVGDEDVSAPSADHVSVEERRKATPHNASDLDGLDPEVEGEDEKENGDSLVIVTPGDRSRDVTRCNAHEDSREQTSGRARAHFGGQQVAGEGGQAREGRRKQNANVANVDGDGEEAQSVVDGAGCDHEARVEGTAGDAAKGMPCSCEDGTSETMLLMDVGYTHTVIEPVPEVGKAILDEVFCGAEVEPRIDCSMA